MSARLGWIYLMHWVQQREPDHYSLSDTFCTFNAVEWRVPGVRKHLQAANGMAA